MKKLHLGCGSRYLEGYVNIDLPAGAHTVQRNHVADLHADIRTLRYEPETVDEVRLHHVFEHFTRPVALALLCRWRDWLRPGGLLRIETPDAMASFRQMASPFTALADKHQVMRHLFGSHEGAWAIHCDGWFEKKFDLTLGSLGYEQVTFAKSRDGVLRNIEVVATRSGASFDTSAYSAAVERLLSMSTIGAKLTEVGPASESEREMLKVWMDEWKSLYDV